MRDDIRSGMELPAIADTYFGNFLRYNRGIRDYIGLSQTSRDDQTRVLVLWGPTGSGKSRFARDTSNIISNYWLDKNNGTGATWFDGYYGQPLLVIDEFYGWVPRDFILRVIDRYPMRVQTKGGSMNFRSKTVIITSNLHPEHWWSRIGLGQAARRRLTAPIGNVVYVASEAYPTQQSYVDSLVDTPMPEGDLFGQTMDYEDLMEWFMEEYNVIPAQP